MHRPYRSRLAIGGVPLHALFAPFPGVCFTGALLTDIAYVKTALPQYSNFSAWLLAFGLAMGVIDAVFGLIDWLLAKPRPASALWHMLGYGVILLIAFINNLVHSRDGWTAVVPTGLTLSIITVILMTIAGFLGQRALYARQTEIRA